MSTTDERLTEMVTSVGTYPVGMPKPSPLAAVLKREEGLHKMVRSVVEPERHVCICGDWRGWFFDDHVREAQVAAIAAALRDDGV